jgi:hypothetical protein
MKTIEDASRREFEAWYIKNITHGDEVYFAKDESDSYICEGIRIGFEAWQAARQSSQSEPVALQYVTQLAIYLHDKFYKEKSPIFEPLDNVMSVLTQIDNMICGLAIPQQAIPSGWKLVPIEPTEEMIEAGREQGRTNELEFRHRNEGAVFIYKAMLSALPTAPIERK